MNPILCTEMVKGKLYYIQSNTYKMDRQIARFKELEHIHDDMYLVTFEDIRKIKKANGTNRNCGLHYGKGYRHNYWFTFYNNHKQVYQKKIDKLYKDATNQYLQEIIGDSNFIYL